MNQKKHMVFLIGTSLFFILSSCKVFYGGTFENQNKAPSDIPDLIVWLRADKGVNSDAVNCAGQDVAVNGTVGCWKDQSGHNNHIKKESGANQSLGPTLKHNSGYSVYFDGNLYPISNESFSMGGTETDCTLISVSKASVGTIADISDGVSVIFTQIISDVYGLNLYHMDGGAIPINEPLNQKMIFTTIYNENLAQIDIYYNGKTLFSEGGRFISMSAVSKFNVGASQGALTGDVYEVLVFNRALSNLERREIELYLSKKYSISLGD